MTTGGGFSKYNAAPSFQLDALHAYFDKYNPPNSSYSNYIRTNRAYPDLSMPGYNYGKATHLIVNRLDAALNL